MTSVLDFGARGDGTTDDTAALTHALQRGDGHVVFPRGDYRITRPLYIPLPQQGRLAISGSGGTARILMEGAGPALHLVGSHRRTAHPQDFQETVWELERFPTVGDLEIVGRHEQADGIRVEGAMQPTFRGLLLRRCRHGIHLTNRARNVLIADCHIYHNRGIGIFLDRINLHQTNIHGNHISYCARGGIVVAGSEIRNIQICSNDIEYNHDLKADSSNDVLFDCREGTVREGTLTGNTIQAVRTPGGANVRFLGAKDHPNAVGLFAITGNLIGSQSRALDLHACRAVTITGNSIYSGYLQALWLEDSEHVVVAGNTIDHNPEYRGTSTDQVVLRNCRHVAVSGTLLQHTREATEPVTTSIDVRGCTDVSLTGVQIHHARTHAVTLTDCTRVRIAGCTLRGKPGDATYRGPLRFEGTNRQLMLTDNYMDGELRLPVDAGIASGNMRV